MLDLAWLRRGVVALVTCVAWGWGVCDSSWATFPGRDGVLMLQPSAGSGIVFVDPRGRGERRICTSGLACGGAGRPVWSPDGERIAFASQGSLSVIYPDGSCLRCARANDDFFLNNASAGAVLGAVEFMPDGQTVTFATRPSGDTAAQRAPILAAIGEDAIGYRPVRRADVVAHAWAADGSAALIEPVRHGSRVQDDLFISTAHGVRRLTYRGADQPSWSPNSRQLAFVRHGHIFLLGVNGRHLTRLTSRGKSSPAWAPDGRSIAFLSDGPSWGGALYIIGSRGQRLRRVARVSGLSVDWQPLTTVPQHDCPQLVGATTVAQSPGVVVTTRQSGAGSGLGWVQTWLGCLRSEHRLVDLLDGGVDDGNATVEGGPFAFSGTKVAYVVNVFERSGIDNATIETRNLASPDANPSSRDIYDGLEEGTDLTVDTLLLAPNDTTVWLRHLVNEFGSEPVPSSAQIAIGYGQTTKVLDTGDPGQLANLRIAGNQITWTHAGAPRTAALP